MKFDKPASFNPIDQLKIVGHATDRIDGPLKTTGTARYAYERRDEVSDPAYGYVVGAAIAKGRIVSIDVDAARAAPGVLAAEVYSEVGETIRPVQIISDRRGYVIATGETREEAVERADAASLLVELDVEPV